MTTEILAMSDEDFLKLNEPPASTGASSETQEPGKTDEETTADEAAAAQAAAAQSEADSVAAEEEARKQQEDADAAALAAAEAAKTDPKETSNGDTVTIEPGEQAGKAKTPAEKKPPADQSGKATSGEDATKTDSSSSGSKAEGSASTPDYEGFYKQVMAPLKANGKTINLQSPQEAIQLMQMGANYTRKMQELAPQRKVLMMLENNGLLDEGKLSFLIDIEKKNPEAIKKLIKDAGIDPLEIDTSVEPTYRVGNHRVSDEEAAFTSAMDDVQNKEGGIETLKVIQTQWDQASKDVLWKNPELMQTIHEQRASGVYTRIADEVERQKTLGILPAQVPFLQAYKVIGDKLAEAGGFDDLVKKELPKTPEVKTPVVSRAAAPKPVVKNSDKASAASATRSTPKTAEVKVNPLSMSDEDFMKQMANRP